MKWATFRWRLCNLNYLGTSVTLGPILSTDENGKCGAMDPFRAGTARVKGRGNRTMIKMGRAAGPPWSHSNTAGMAHRRTHHIGTQSVINQLVWEFQEGGKNLARRAMTPPPPPPSPPPSMKLQYACYSVLFIEVSILIWHEVCSFFPLQISSFRFLKRISTWAQ